MKKGLLLVTMIGLGLAMAILNTAAFAKSSISGSVPTNELVRVTYGEPYSLDPAIDYETAGTEIIQQIYDPLITFRRENTNEYVPMLATDWQISLARDVYTFDIRQGVVFHNGNLLTPEDVAYTFQRGILIGDYSSPQWLLTEPLLGVGISNICDIIDESVCDDRSALQAYQIEHPAEVVQACQIVKDAIVADADNWQVAFNLAQPWSPFLNTLIGSWGSILDKEWAVANGAWDGDCATWHNYYTSYDGDPLATIANGTGPFKLDHWTPVDEIVLTKNSLYWRSTPMWEGGPTGPTMFDKFTRKIVTDGTVRADMLLNGEADWASLDSADFSRANDQVLFAYDDPAGVEPTLIHPTGTLKLLRGGYAPSASDFFFTYNIQTDGSINYIGSGTLDGNGIPVDFFSDIHVRKAFNYSFNWEQYNDEIFGGTALQRTGPIIFGLDGYDSSQPIYYYDQDKAKYEFSLAWEGQVATHGFWLTLAYNQGNTARKRAAEILETNIEALSDNFEIQVLELDLNTYNTEQRAGRIPIFVGGWTQDIPHPHNWAVPWLNGFYANRQRLPDELKSKYETMIQNCVILVGDEARLCYEEIQTETYEDALDIFLLQGKTYNFFNAEIQGNYNNPATGGLLSYYPLTKSELPSVEEASPESATTILMTSTLGTEMTAEIPIGAVDDPVQIVLTPDVPTYGNPTSFKLGDFSFDVQAFDELGDLLEGFTLNEPMILTIQYTDIQVQTLDESSLMLFWWDGADWVDAACGAINLDIENNILEVPICHFSDFAIGGVSYDIYLPMLTR